MNFLRNLFLGKWWHWLLLIIITLLLWQAGEIKLHVTYFNWFLMALLAGTVVSLLVLIYGTPSGEQITRDKLLENDDEQLMGGE